MLKEFTCIICPRGCVIEADIEAVSKWAKLDPRQISASGVGCQRGLSYVQQELLNPMRTIATLVKVVRGAMPLVSVRLTKPIPKARIGEVLAALHAMEITAPVEAGQVLMRNVAGRESDIIATRHVSRASGY